METIVNLGMNSDFIIFVNENIVLNITSNYIFMFIFFPWCWKSLQVGAMKCYNDVQYYRVIVSYIYMRFGPQLT